MNVFCFIIIIRLNKWRKGVSDMSNHETREYIISELDRLRDMIPGMWGVDPMYYVGSEDIKEDYLARKDVEVMQLIFEAIQFLTDANESEDE